MMVFSLGGRKSKYNQMCKWKNETIEEVVEFKYLGFTFKASGKHSAHIGQLKRDATKKIGSVWGMGERLFPGHFEIRMQIYKYKVVIRSGWKHKK